MEIFIPGLTALLLLALFLFLILPRVGAPVLVILSLVLLAYGVNNHMDLFYSEYRYMSWPEAIKPYASFAIVGVILLLILGYILYLFGVGSGNSLPASVFPSLNGVMNATSSQNNSTGVVGSVMNSLSKVANGVGNQVATTTTNLGNMLRTPNNASTSRNNGIVSRVSNLGSNIGNKVSNLFNNSNKSRNRSN